MRLTRAQLDQCRALRRKEGREAAGQFLLEGWRALTAAIAADAPIVSVAVRADLVEHPQLSPLKKRGIPIATMSERDSIRVSATEHSQGVVASVEMTRSEPASLVKGDGVILALDSVGDPGNVGTMIRTADWFGARGIVLGRGCVDVYNEKVVRSTAGSLFHIPILRDVDLPTFLQGAGASGYSRVVADISGTVRLGDWRPTNQCVLILGSEAHGSSDAVRALADVSITIPKFGRAESLNVAVAAGILLAHVRLSAGSGI